MIRLRKYGGVAIVIVSILLAVQAGASLLMRTNRGRGYLIAHLESAFGRPVQASRFSVQILPIPELEVEGITIGEDRAFGSEYFLRAEQMTAAFRWMGLLRGHIEFGTMSFTRPTLILVRNSSGRWNLERWLPPSRPFAMPGASQSSSAFRSESTNHLQKIDFDEGRINFKQDDEKKPFAFTGVSGSVEQVSPGRWQLKLEAHPWRSGVALQSTGILQVTGDVAGTSARLQPAQLRIHWGKVSLADLFRMITGNDSGVRGEFALDGNASVGIGAAADDAPANAWRFTVQARATDIHRWDLNEREDNPRINVNVKGHWELAANEIRAEELRVELPHSNLMGTAALQTSGSNRWQAKFQSMALQGEDLLAWYRAFHPGVAEEVALDDSITGSVSASGWPLRWDDAAVEGAPGSLRLPGRTVAHLDPFHGTMRNGKIGVEGFRLRLPALAAQAATEKSERSRAKQGVNVAAESTIEASLLQDSSAHHGELRLIFRLPESASVFKLASAFGYPLNKGWDYQGAVSGPLAWNWDSASKVVRRNGSLELTKARLQVAGLNEPLKIEAARLEWKDGVRSAAIEKVDAFGAEWSGTINEAPESLGSDEKNWHFLLHADHLDATELDRWAGPRSRPNWLQRLLPSLLGGDTNAAHASELLRQVSADGELTVDAIGVEKIKLAKAHAKLSLHALRLDVRDAEAQWAGGTVRGTMQALFSPLPKYELNAEIENVNMAQLPWPTRWAERWTGLASGKIHLTTTGVGREELLKQLAGGGDLKLAKIEFRGWDVELSTESGGPSGASSRWTSGTGEFQLSDQKVTLDGFRLDALHQRTQLSGTISFGMDGNLAFTPRPHAIPGTRTLSQARELRLSGHLENPAVAVLPAGSEQARP